MLDTNTTINLTINGEVQSFSTPIALPDVLNKMNLNPRLIAIEYNGEILHRQYWQDRLMQEGDRLEIVTIVGGG
jgi:sulfur carrier protein